MSRQYPSPHERLEPGAEPEGVREFGASAMKAVQMNATPREKLQSELDLFRQIQAFDKGGSVVPELPTLNAFGYEYLASEPGRRLIARWCVSFADYLGRLDYIADPVLSEAETDRDTARLAQSMRRAATALAKRANEAGLKAAG